MKMPNIFITRWEKKDCEADDPKLGLDWYSRKGYRLSKWSGGGINFIWWGGQIDITFVSDSDAYAKEFMDESHNWSLFPYKRYKRPK